MFVTVSEVVTTIEFQEQNLVTNLHVTKAVKQSVTRPFIADESEKKIPKICHSTCFFFNELVLTFHYSKITRKVSFALTLTNCVSEQNFAIRKMKLNR